MMIRACMPDVRLLRKV